MDFVHLDVFASCPFSGNSVTVFFPSTWPTPGQMLAITQEFRHFESIFARPAGSSGHWSARVFDLAEELDFAGHPVLGAAAALHGRLGGDRARLWSFDLPARTVTVQTTVTGGGYSAILDQGRPEYGPPVNAAMLGPVLRGLGLSAADLTPDLRPAVISTGLRYLLIPVSAAALARASIVVADFASRLSAAGAQYVYLLDPDRPEGRHWDNAGRPEDVATGSAAGPVAAYLAQAGRVRPNEAFILHQGRHAGRPSQLRAEAHGSAADITRVRVGGDVALVATGKLRSTPEPAQ
jgi:trans-2,3-dihydro-3-hydroxyanthranilate isomerase